MKPGNAQGFTLAEILTVVAVIGSIAVVVVPLLSFLDSKRLDVAAEEVGNALRYAISEAGRTGGYVLADAQTAPGHLRIVRSNASGADLGAVSDPLTKRAMDIDVSASTFSAQVDMTPRFLQGGTAYAQLLIGPATQLHALDGAIDRGPLQSGSGIVLSLDSASVTVVIDEVTGRVTLP